MGPGEKHGLLLDFDCDQTDQILFRTWVRLGVSISYQVNRGGAGKLSHNNISSVFRCASISQNHVGCSVSKSLMFSRFQDYRIFESVTECNRV